MSVSAGEVCQGIIDWALKLENEDQFGAFITDLDRLIGMYGPQLETDTGRKIVSFIANLKETCYERPLKVSDLPPYVDLGEVLSPRQVDQILNEFPNYRTLDKSFDRGAIVSRREGTRVRVDLSKVEETFGGEAFSGRRVPSRLPRPIMVHYRGDVQDGPMGLPFHYDPRRAAMCSVVVCLSKRNCSSRTVIWTNNRLVEVPELRVGQGVLMPVGVLPHARTALARNEEIILWAIGLRDIFWKPFSPIVDRVNGNEIVNRLRSL